MKSTEPPYVVPSAEAAARLPRSCNSCLAWEHGVCGTLTVAELCRLAATSSRRHQAAGTEIFAPSGSDDQCVSLLSGTVKLSKALGNGRQQIIALAIAPTLIEAPFDTSRDVVATAVTEADICVFKRSVLEAISRGNHALEHRLHRQSLTKLEDAQDLLLTLGRRTARERVACFLLASFARDRATPDSSAENETIDLPLSRSEIGDYLGLTIETVSRQFSQLKHAGIIAIPDSRRVVLKGLRQLEAAAGR